MQKIIYMLAYAPIRFYARWAQPKKALIFLLNIQRRITTLISDRASDYDNGVHPKHRLMQYHLFFTKRLEPNERVLDIGSGRGFLSYNMAKAGAQVTGIELSKRNVDISNKLYQDPKLKFIHGDALKDLPQGTFDTAVMSNVLEHIEHRVEFLKKVQAEVNPKRWLLRIPCFDRDWQVPLAKELGVDSRLDETHFTEYTVESFIKELTAAGLKPIHIEVCWGEIWSEVIPIKSNEQ
jgi:SAM-dependent methyltransferase